MPTTTKNRKKTLRTPVEPTLLDFADFAAMTRVSTRTAKRIAIELPEMIVRLGRRVLFRREAVERWIQDGCPRPTVRAS